jgi:hypothetical protein
MLEDWYATVRYRPERPMLYSALVPRRLVDNVVRTRNRFFQGMAPDVSSGLHILAGTQTYVETNLIAVVTQLPSNDSRWSNGLSVSKGAELGGRFLREFGAESPLGRLPLLTSAVIFQTLVEFARLQPECVPPAMVDITRFARAAAVEIESAGRRDGAAMHWALLKATQATGISVLSIFEQVRTILSARSLGHGWLRRRLMGLLNGGAAVAPSTGIWARSLAEALDLVATENSAEARADSEPRR